MEQRWRKQPCNTVIDCEFKPCYNVSAACNRKTQLPFTDRYCQEQKEWFNNNCRPRPKPTCCRKRDRNKEICEHLGFHRNWECLREQIQKQNNKTMEALTTCRPGRYCEQWRYGGGPYYSLSGPVYHPPGMMCTDYSLYIPTDQLRNYCNRHLARFKLHPFKRKRNIDFSKLQLHALEVDEDDDSLFEEEDETDARENMGVQVSPDNNVSAPTETLYNFQPNTDGTNVAVNANASVNNPLQRYGGKLDGTAAGGDQEVSKEAAQEEQCPKCNEIGEDACRKKVNNGNHYDDCTCRLCVKKKGAALAPKITDKKGEMCRKLWLKTYRDPCSGRLPPCIDDEPQEEINPETGDVICTKCANCICPVCCKQRAYARIKPHHYYANGLEHPNLKYKRMSFQGADDNNNVADANPESSHASLEKMKKRGSSLSRTSSSLRSVCSGSLDRNNNCRRRPRNPQQPDLDPSKFRYDDEGIENNEYYTGDCEKENPTRKPFGLDVTYRECCCSEPVKDVCKKRPSFEHAGTQYCHFPDPLDVQKMPSKKTKSHRRMVRKPKKNDDEGQQPGWDSNCPPECTYDIRLPTPNDYNTTTYKESYSYPIVKCRCNPGRFGSKYHPYRMLQMRDWEVYPMELPCGQGDGGVDWEKLGKSDQKQNERSKLMGRGKATTQRFGMNRNKGEDDLASKFTSEMYQRYLKSTN